MPNEMIQPEPNDDGTRIRLISQGFNSWKVQVLFADKGVDADAITRQLHEVKKSLARQFCVPDRVLEYAELISKQVTRSGLLVQMRIVKPNLPSAKPVFRAHPLRDESGMVFSDMRLEADFYPFDEFNNFLTRETVEARLAERSIDRNCVNWDAVSEVLHDMEADPTPRFNVDIGRGIFPGIGQASRITYGIPAEQERFLQSAWLGTRPVEKGEFLLEISNASSSFKWGRNVYGRELEPVPGMQTKLEPGEGARLSLRGTRLLAQQNGLLMFQRIGRDRRDQDAFGLVPARITGLVLPAESLIADQHTHLELDKPTILRGSLPPGARITSKAALYIDGDVANDCSIDCQQNVRIGGSVRHATVISNKHLTIAGDAVDSELGARLTLQIDGHAVRSTLRAGELICAEQDQCTASAMQETQIDRAGDSGGSASVIRLDLRRFLENQQVTGREALDELRGSLANIVDIFGPEISLNVTEGTAQRMLLKWLRRQKSAGVGNYTHAEVREFRTVLEMIPLIRNQLAAIGMELRDVTAQLQETPSDPADD